MKICTLIVRLVGVALLARSIIALVELNSQFRAMGVDVRITRIHVYTILEILVGLVCAAFAPFVARLLTLDAPADEAADAAPNSRLPPQLPSSPEIQSSDSRRTPPSGGCG